MDYVGVFALGLLVPSGSHRSVEREPLIGCSPVDKAILHEIATLNMSLPELLSVGKPNALGSCTLAR